MEIFRESIAIATWKGAAPNRKNKAVHGRLEWRNALPLFEQKSERRSKLFRHLGPRIEVTERSSMKVGGVPMLLKSVGVWIVPRLRLWRRESAGKESRVLWKCS